MADLRIDVNVSGVVKAEKVVKRSFDSMKRSSIKLNNSILLVEKAVKDQTTALSKVVSSSNKASNSIKKYAKSNKEAAKSVSIFTVAAGNLAAKGLAVVAAQLIEAPRILKEYSDAWIKVTNIIKLGVKSEEELVMARQKVIDISQETRTDLVAQVTLFNRLTLSQKELGASSDEILSVIKGVGQALGVTATSALESRGSLIQLSQAFGQPIVRAEEFNSILEGTPRIAKALADGFGLTRAALRKLVLEGKVTNKEFFQALKSQLPLLQQEFQNVTPTIDQGLTVIKNGMITVIGQFNELTGIAPAVAEAFVDIGKGMSSFAKIIADLVKATSEKSLSEQLVNLKEKLDDLENPGKRTKLRQEMLQGLKKDRDERVKIYMDEIKTKLKARGASYRDTRPELGGEGVAVGKINEEESKKADIRLQIKRIEIKLREKIQFDHLKTLDEFKKDEVRAFGESEKSKLDLAKKNFSALGIISDADKNRLIADIYKKRDEEVAVTNDIVTANEIAAARIEKIELRILQRRRNIESEKKRQMEESYGWILKLAEKEEKKAYSALIAKSVIEGNAEKSLAKEKKKKHKEEMKLILEKAKGMKDLNLLRLEGLKKEGVSPVPPQSSFEQYVDGLNESIEITTLLGDTTITAFQGMESALNSFFMTGKIGYRELALSAVAELTKIFVKTQLIAPLANLASGFDLIGMLSGIGGSSTSYATPIVDYAADFSGMKMAKGGAFTNSIVSQPTMFASGGVPGIMGEKGAEAIMPLTRTSSGNLGVESTMPVININVENNNSKQSEVTITEQGMDDQGQLVIGIVIDAMDRNVGNLGDVTRMVANRK